MNNSIEEMLKRYDVRTAEEKKNAIKEIVQEIALCGLARGDFFKKGAFYGGTALRIFYGLNRFSEDLDFSLMVPDIDFEISDYFPMLAKELAAFGLKMDVAEKPKTADTNIKSAFLKGNTRELVLLFYSDSNLSEGLAANENIKIKFEVDVNPPSGATFEHKYRLLPAPYEVNVYDKPSLFAGKIHAVLCRAWKSRVKGRDLYDYVYYMSTGTRVNLGHLKARLAESGLPIAGENFDLGTLKELLCERFATIDYEEAKKDVRPFIKDKRAIDVWSAEFFTTITKDLQEA